MPTDGWSSSTPSTSAIARLVSSSWTRCSGLRVWKASTHFFRRAAQRRKIVVARQLQHFELAGNVELTPALHLGDSGMLQVERAKDLERRIVQIPGVFFLDRHNRQQFVLVVAQGNVL